MYLFHRQPHRQFGTAENVYVRRRLRARFQYGTDIQRHRVPFRRSEYNTCETCISNNYVTGTRGYKAPYLISAIGWSTGHSRRLQLHSVCIRTNRMWQKFLDAGRRLAAEPARDNTKGFRTRLRSHIRHGRREVLSARFVHRNLQRRSERSVEFGHQAQAGAKGEPRKRSLRKRYAQQILKRVSRRKSSWSFVYTSVTSYCDFILLQSYLITLYTTWSSVKS